MRNWQFTKQQPSLDLVIYWDMINSENSRNRWQWTQKNETPYRCKDVLKFDGHLSYCTGVLKYWKYAVIIGSHVPHFWVCCARSFITVAKLLIAIRVIPRRLSIDLPLNWIIDHPSHITAWLWLFEFTNSYPGRQPHASTARSLSGYVCTGRLGEENGSSIKREPLCLPAWWFNIHAQFGALLREPYTIGVEREFFWSWY